MRLGARRWARWFHSNNANASISGGSKSHREP